jgi:hypothetical protein
MALPIDKQANVVRGIVDTRVTFAEEENVMFIGEVISEDEKQRIENAISPEEIFNPDQKVTQINVAS